MSRKHLQSYLDKKNFWRVQIDKKAPYTIDTLTRVEAESLMSSLECDLSPENVSCDGELSRSEVQARMREYLGAMKALGTLFPQVRPQYDEWDLFNTVEPVQSYMVGQRVVINHDKLGGRAVGTIVKVNRVKCLVEFPAAGKFHVPFGMMEII